VGVGFVYLRLIVRAVCFVLLCVWAPPARSATPCPIDGAASAELASRDGEERLAWIDRHLSLRAHRARVWTWGWGVGIGVATLANLAPLPFVAPGNRIDWYVGAVGNVVLNTGVGLFLGLGYHHWGAGALNAVSGSAIGEAIILTQPTGSIDDLRRYRAGALESAAPRPLSLAYALVF
jgi:hypothetical protein